MIPVDWQVHNTYYVVAHIHYVLIGANVFPVFAGFYYWLPKMTGRMMNEALGKVSFWVMFIGFNVGFFPMHILGLLGMPRRIYTYEPGSGFGPLNMVVTIGSFILGLGVLISVVDFLVSMCRGTCGQKSLEFRRAGMGNGLAAGAIRNGACAGGRHAASAVGRPRRGGDPYERASARGGRWTQTTTWLDAEPDGIATIPEDTLAPTCARDRDVRFLLYVVFQMLWVSLAALIGMLLTGCYWMWPRMSKEVA